MTANINDFTQMMHLLKLDYRPTTDPEEYKPEYGMGSLFFVPAIRGKSNIDNDALLEYLNTDESIKSITENTSNITYQDLLLPQGPDHLPKNPIAEQLAEEILQLASIMTGMPSYSNGPMWTIRHGYQHQTYPHSHDPDDLNEIQQRSLISLACVYWAQLPEGSGNLEMYPLGVGNVKMTYVKPVVGDFIIFPADLLHGVRQHTNKTEERISLSMNLLSTEIPFDELNKIYRSSYNT